eukprot:Pgem_evm1s156
MTSETVFGINNNNDSNKSNCINDYQNDQSGTITSCTEDTYTSSTAIPIQSATSTTEPVFIKSS